MNEGDENGKSVDFLHSKQHDVCPTTYLSISIICLFGRTIIGKERRGHAFEREEEEVRGKREKGNSDILIF